MNLNYTAEYIFNLILNYRNEFEIVLISIDYIIKQKETEKKNNN